MSMHCTCINCCCCTMANRHVAECVCVRVCVCIPHPSFEFWMVQAKGHYHLNCRFYPTRCDASIKSHSVKCVCVVVFCPSIGSWALALSTHSFHFSVNECAVFSLSRFFSIHSFGTQSALTESNTFEFSIEFWSCKTDTMMIIIIQWKTCWMCVCANQSNMHTSTEWKTETNICLMSNCSHTQLGNSKSMAHFISFQNHLTKILSVALSFTRALVFGCTVLVNELVHVRIRIHIYLYILFAAA